MRQVINKMTVSVSMRTAKNVCRFLREEQNHKIYLYNSINKVELKNELDDEIEELRYLIEILDKGENVTLNGDITL